MHQILAHMPRLLKKRTIINSNQFNLNSNTKYLPGDHIDPWAHFFSRGEEIAVVSFWWMEAKIRALKKSFSYLHNPAFLCYSPCLISPSMANFGPRLSESDPLTEDELAVTKRETG